MNAASVPTLTMNDGYQIPQLGWGVMGIRPADMTKQLAAAVETGYRMIDTAQVYGNEEGLGAAIAVTDIPRDELFVTTKVGLLEHGYDETIRAVSESLRRLRLEQVDLMLIHWPLPKFDRYVETWDALIEIRSQGKARSIGVSNFTPSQLERLVEQTGVVPAVNQVELHPRFPQDELRKFDSEHDIITQAWSPLERGGQMEGSNRPLLEEPTIVELAAALGRSPAQVALRWNAQLGNCVIPKAATVAHLRENIDIFGFSLSDEEMAQINGLAVGRLGPDPDSYHPG